MCRQPMLQSRWCGGAHPARCRVQHGMRCAIWRSGIRGPEQLVGVGSQGWVGSHTSYIRRLLALGTGPIPRPHGARTPPAAGLFFLVNKCTTVLLRGPHAAYTASPYVDEHGEEDSGLKRGRQTQPSAHSPQHTTLSTLSPPTTLSTLSPPTSLSTLSPTTTPTLPQTRAALAACISALRLSPPYAPHLCVLLTWLAPPPCPWCDVCGRPLQLSPERVAALSRLWTKHGLAGEVIRERVMRDRVIREAFY